MEYFLESLVLLRRRMCWPMEDIVHLVQRENKRSSLKNLAIPWRARRHHYIWPPPLGWALHDIQCGLCHHEIIHNCLQEHYQSSPSARTLHVNFREETLAKGFHLWRHSLGKWCLGDSWKILQKDASAVQGPYGCAGRTLGLHVAAYGLGHWKPNVVIIPTLSSLVALEVVVMTTSGATSDDKVGVMTGLVVSSWYLQMLWYHKSFHFATKIKYVWNKTPRIEMVSSYLDNRKQAVLCHNELSCLLMLPVLYHRCLFLDHFYSYCVSIIYHNSQLMGVKQIYMQMTRWFMHQMITFLKYNRNYSNV